MLNLFKWLCLIIAIVYMIDTIVNRAKGCGMDKSRIIFIVGGLLGFIVCLFI